MPEYVFVNGELCHTDELYHHGVKGQKHGHRRWQNPDGSLTPAGRIRYGVGKASKKIASAVKSGASKVGAKTSDTIKKKREERRVEKLRKKPLSKLTDAELKERIARLTEEKKASDLQKQISDIDQNRLSMGKKFTQAALTNVVAPAAVDAGKEVLTKWLKKQGMDIAGLGEVKDAYSMLKKEADTIKLQKEILDNKKQIRLNEDFFESREKELAEREAKRKQEAKEAKEAEKKSKEDEKKSKEAEKKAKKPVKKAKKPVKKSIRNKPISSISDDELLRFGESWMDWYIREH